MEEYIFISSTMNGCDTTAIKIIANGYRQALSKAYSYFCCDGKLKIEEFNILCDKLSTPAIRRTFKEFTGQTIIYLAMTSEKCIIDDLEEIDIIKCK